jgi:hypothetical protein
MSFRNSLGLELGLEFESKSRTRTNLSLTTHKLTQSNSHYGISTVASPSWGAIKAFGLNVSQTLVTVSYLRPVQRAIPSIWQIAMQTSSDLKKGVFMSNLTKPIYF